MNQELDSELLEIRLNPLAEHQALISNIHRLRNKLFEEKATIDFSVVSERVKDGFSYVDEKTRENKTFSLDDICIIHKSLGFEGRYRGPESGESTCVLNGEDYPYISPNAEQVPELMKKYADRYSSRSESEREPLEKICASYLLFELVHPFKDGNGRTGRLLCAWQMLLCGYQFLAPYVEKQWGEHNRAHASAFKSRLNNYYACLNFSKEFDLFCARFYLYFLNEIQAMMNTIAEKK